MHRIQGCRIPRGSSVLRPSDMCVGVVFREDVFRAYSRIDSGINRTTGEVSCRSSKEEDAQRRLEEVMSEAQQLREQYSELMRQASDIRVDGTEDGLRVREELFKMAMEELEAVLGVTEDIPPSLGSESVVEELAGMIERGEDLPPPPEGMFVDEETESAESFLSRIESARKLLKEVVDGKLKPGSLLGSGDSEDFDDGLLSENPDARSRHAPDIPSHIMDMYTFGERVLYIIRRGDRLGSAAKAIELLDSYGLFADDFVLETNWFRIEGVQKTIDYCQGIDKAASRVECTNLLMRFPDFSDDCDLVAEGTNDMIVSIPVPHWYIMYCRQAGKDINRMGGSEQAKHEINLPEVLFPHNKSPQFEERPAVSNEKTSMQFYKTTSMPESDSYTGTGGAQVPPCKGLLSANDWIIAPSDTAEDHQDPQSNRTSYDPSEVESIEDFTPDDAEMFLRGLFGDDFDDAMEQIPKKLEMPENIDEHCQCFFENDPSTIHLALSWFYEVDLVSKRVSRIRVIWNWSNTGAVHADDVTHVVALECNHIRFAIENI